MPKGTALFIVRFIVILAVWSPATGIGKTCTDVFKVDFDAIAHVGFLEELAAQIDHFDTYRAFRNHPLGPNFMTRWNNRVYLNGKLVHPIHRLIWALNNRSGEVTKDKMDQYIAQVTELAVQYHRGLEKAQPESNADVRLWVNRGDNLEQALLKVVSLLGRALDRPARFITAHNRGDYQAAHSNLETVLRSVGASRVELVRNSDSPRDYLPQGLHTVLF